MVYLIGFIGLVGGFVVGQMVLYFLLRHKSREELLHNDALKWQYGILNWLIAALGAASFVMMYQHYFG